MFKPSCTPVRIVDCRVRNDASNDVPQTRGRPFVQGHPGGPGRPAGARSKATLILDALADGEAEAVLQKVIDSAKGGDLKAAEIILSRTWPARKGRGARLNIPPVAAAADVVAAISAVLEAASQGEISPDEASVLANVLDLKRRALETADFGQRLAALEAQKR